MRLGHVGLIVVLFFPPMFLFLGLALAGIGPFWSMS